MLALCAGLLGVSISVACADELVVASNTSSRIEAMCRQGVETPCVTRVGGWLKSARSGEPLRGKKLSFVAGDVVICSSLTDESGIASCSGVAPSAVALSTSGYRVLFEGEGVYQPASAGGVTLVRTQAR